MVDNPIDLPGLSPCPFCGSEESEIVHCEEDCCGAKPRWIQCECGCELAGNWNSDTDAIEAWNGRRMASTHAMTDNLADHTVKFRYSLIVTAKISGREFEFHKEFESPCMFRAGDSLYLDELDNLRVRFVTWYIDEPGWAYLELDDMTLGGKPEQWEFMIPEVFDFSVPALTEKQ